MADLGTISVRTEGSTARNALPLSSIQAGKVVARAGQLQAKYLYVPFWNANNLAAIGTGVLSGVVNDSAVPVPRCMVRLYYRPTGVLIRSAFTDAAGAFVFTALDPTDMQNYFVIAFDPAGGTQYNAIIFDRLTAV